MTNEPNKGLSIGSEVYKHGGGYQGPGIVRGIIMVGDGYRYIVGHKIEGGTGEFLHIYSEANLR